MRSPGTSPAPATPRGFIALGFFLLLGALAGFLAGTTLVGPGTALDRIWLANPRAYAVLGPYRKAVEIPFLLLGAALAFAGIGWLRQRVWGWRLAVAIIAIHFLGDWVNIFLGHLIQGALGVLISGTLLFYVTRANVRIAFQSGR